jgi:MFS family permease
LALAALTHTFGVAMPTMCMPVLFKEISGDLNLSLVQIGAVWGGSALTGMFSGLVSGSLGDRFGARRTLAASLLLGGLAGALRGIAGGFLSLSVTVLLSGFLFMTIPPNVHKTCGIWFARKRLGLANGVVSMGMALGFMGASLISATYLSPWLGGWRSVLFFYGALSAFLSFAWLLVPAGPATGDASAARAARLSARQAFGRVLRIKRVWLLGLTLMGMGGGINGMLGYLPIYLRNEGWAGASADQALATFHAASMLCVIPLSILSDRLGVRKQILVAATMMITAGIGLLTVAEGNTVWFAVILAGAFRDGFMALFMTSVLETDGVGAALAGTAIGLVLLMLQLGNFLSPIIGNSLAAVAPNLSFLFWAGLGAISVLLFSRIKERAPEAPLGV